MVEKILVLKKNLCIDRGLMESNLISLISDVKYDQNELFRLSDTILNISWGLSYFDIFLLKTFLDKVSLNLGRPLKILEIGCGTSTRVMRNLGHEVNSIALTDDHMAPLLIEGLTAQTTEFIVKDVFDCNKELIKSFNDCDVFFLDGDHTYDFAKYIYENLVLMGDSKKPIICHDFSNIEVNPIYGEQVYVVDDFLYKDDTDNGYSLFTFTSQSLLILERIDNITNSGFITNLNKFVKPVSCLAIITPENFII